MSYLTCYLFYYRIKPISIFCVFLTYFSKYSVTIVKRLGDFVGEEDYIKIVNRINSDNFYDFMNYYDLTYGELLGIIDYGVHSDISQIRKNTLYKLLRTKQCILKFTDSKIGVIADTHIGSPHMSWNKIYRTYDFLLEHGIYTIILLGDLFHGPSYRSRNDSNRSITQCYQQFVECEEHYPKGFQNFLLHGNHEQRFDEVGMDLWNMLAIKRDDFFSLGIGRCYVKMNSFIISLNHPGIVDRLLPPALHYDIALYAHYHCFYQGNKRIYIGTCSNLVNRPPSSKIDNPGFAILSACDKDLCVTAYDLSTDNIQPLFTKTYSRQKKR